MTLLFLFSLIGSLFLSFLGGLRYVYNLDLEPKADEDVGQKSFSSPLGHNPAVDVCITQLKMMTSTNLTYKYDNKICLIAPNLTESPQICH